MARRLFVAVRPPVEVRTALLGAMGAVAGARWQSDDQLHITLRYVGEVEPPAAEEIATALAGIDAPAIDVRLAGAGVFDRAGQVHTLWAGVEPREPLARLHRKVDRALTAIGLRPEGRAYLPHVTLARFARLAHADPSAFVAAMGGFATPAFRIDAFGLFESLPGSAGRVYEMIARYPLR